MKATRPSTGNLPNVQDSKPVPAAEPKPPTFEANGKALVLFPVRKDWGCKARDLGRLLNYADDGKKLVGKIGNEWNKEFIEGVDFVNEVHQVTTSGEPPRRPETILLRSGINLVCLKTRQPIGREIRQWLAREVMVQIADTGAYVAPEIPSPPPGTLRVAILEAEVRKLREMIEGRQAPALPAPKEPNVKAVEAWGKACGDAQAKLAEVERVTYQLKLAVGELAKVPRPVINPAPVPRRPAHEEPPYGGKYYYARLAMTTSLTRNMLAAPLDKDTILIADSVWFAWLGGDVEAGKEIGRACDKYGLAHDAIGATIARLVVR